MRSPAPSIVERSLHREEPQRHRSFAEEAQGQIVGRQKVCERRRQKGQPTQTGERINAPKFGAEVDLKMTVADQEAIEAVKSYSDDHAPRNQLKKL